VHIMLAFRPHEDLLGFSCVDMRWAGRAPRLVLALPLSLFVANTPELAPLLELPPRIVHGLPVVSALEKSASARNLILP
jgi:hypothetical protein